MKVHPRAALFLDRDGVINVNHGYVHTAEATEFIPGIFDLVMRARQAGMAVVVITNQAGIGRGYYTEEQFLVYTAWMQEQFATRDAPIDRVYFCPDHPEHGIGPYRRETPMRKPGPGMLLQAALELDLDLPRSVLVGDSETDIQAGQRAGLGRTILLVHNTGEAVDTQADEAVQRLSEIAFHPMARTQEPGPAR